jgi:hypothetical protein
MRRSHSFTSVIEVTGGATMAIMAEVPVDTLIENGVKHVWDLHGDSPNAVDHAI